MKTAHPRATFAVLFLTTLATGAALAAQSNRQARVPLSIEEALQRALPASETVEIARASVRRAHGEERRARSEFFPQLTASVSYTKLLESQFSGFASQGSDSTDSPESCDRFVPNPTLPIGERVDSLEAAVRCASGASPFSSFRDLPFGRENTYSAGLAFSQTLFAGGRVRGGADAAAAGVRAADIGLRAAEAGLILDVVQAYYDAALSDRLLTVAQTTLAQADTTFRQTALREEVGAAPQFDALRARVARDNQVPVVIQRRAERDLAFLRLRQLLNLPSDQPLELVTELTETDPEAVPVLADLLASAPDTAVDHRAAVRQADAEVDARASLLRAARGASLPSLVLTSQYARVVYPANGLPTVRGSLSNWSVGLGVQIPLFTGGRLGGEAMIAEANLAEARLRRQQALEEAQLEARDARNQYEAAQALWRASEGTASQATQAHQIAQVRFSEGLGTQTELLDARIALQQAEWNRALAARDIHVARIRLALLSDLPFAVGASSLAAAARAATRAAPGATTTTPLQTSTAGFGFP